MALLKSILKKLILEDYVIIVLLILFVFGGFIYSDSVNVLKKENNELRATIKVNNKQIDNLSTDIGNLKLDVVQQMIIVDNHEKELSLLKDKTKILNKKYEKIISNYNGLSSDDKWVYFRSTINK